MGRGWRRRGRGGARAALITDAHESRPPRPVTSTGRRRGLRTASGHSETSVLTPGGAHCAKWGSVVANIIVRLLSHWDRFLLICLAVH